MEWFKRMKYFSRMSTCLKVLRRNLSAISVTDLMLRIQEVVSEYRFKFTFVEDKQRKISEELALYSGQLITIKSELKGIRELLESSSIKTLHLECNLREARSLIATSKREALEYTDSKIELIEKPKKRVRTQSGIKKKSS